MGALKVQRRFSTPTAANGSGPRGSGSTGARGSSATSGSSQARTASARLAAALASRWGVLIVFPSLVLVVGIFLTWNAQLALRGSNLELAETRMGDEALLVAEHLSASFENADVVLDDLRDLSTGMQPDTPVLDVAIPLRRLIHGRAGVSYVSVSFPDGTFEGAFLDDDGTVRFQVSHLRDGKTEEWIYDYGPRATLVLRTTRTSHYDPRERPFYLAAVSSREPIWTEPYPFARTGDTGISRAVAVREGPLLHAVLTIDFDVRRLSPLLVRRSAHAERPTILFDEEGTILADPQVNLAERSPTATARAGVPFQLSNYRSRSDPVLTAFFEQKARLPSASFLGFATPEGRYLAATAALVGDRSPAWRVAFLAPEATFLASLRVHRERSILFAGLALFVATLLSAAFARLITRVRKEAADAREAARIARKEAKELGSYRLLEKLGEGGMGEVWRAEHRLLARQAAIKLIKGDEHLAASDTARERFRREAQSLAALRSRNTIELFDYGVSDDGTFFYVMELLDGLDLETLVQRDGPQPVDRSLQLLIQVCRSLAEAHEAGLVHRDIKPANIFVCRVADELDVVKVLDFGLVRRVDAAPQPEGLPGTCSALPSPSVSTPNRRAANVAGLPEDALTGDTLPGDGSPLPDATSSEVRADPEGSTAADNPRLTRADHIMGTPSFMAPEQALGREVDHRADIYAVGCVAFWLLAGRTVFSGTTAMAELTAHLTEIPQRLEDIVAEPLPPGLSALVTRCLAKSPEKRPQTASELKTALAEIARGCGGDWASRAGAWWELQRPMERELGLSPTLSEDVSSARTLVAEAIDLLGGQTG